MWKTAPNSIERTADCKLCPRLVELREDLRKQYPSWHNAPVNGFGAVDAPILLVGLAPGLKGANRTGRPFTGDFAGHLLFETLSQMNLSTGNYAESPDDDVELVNIRIVNSVRCLPPKNKPDKDEIDTCREFLKQDMEAMPKLKVIITLGRIAHSSALKVLNLKESQYPFGHNKQHDLPNGLKLIASYHCSRYNTQTKRLTPAMFKNVFKSAKLAASL